LKDFVSAKGLDVGVPLGIAPHGAILRVCFFAAGLFSWRNPGLFAQIIITSHWLAINGKALSKYVCRFARLDVPSSLQSR
jgi:hypothetical protein